MNVRSVSGGRPGRLGGMAVGASTSRRGRREEILEIAVRMFAERGYHGVSMDDIGSAAGVTGPALYHHFAGKEAMLVAAHPGDPRAALESLVDFHVEFALTNPGVIAVHLQELDRLPEEPRREIRRLQRLYVEEWVGLLDAVRPDLSAAEARVLVHATFGLMNSTPFLAGEVDRERRAALLRTGALAALLDGGGGAGSATDAAGRADGTTGGAH